MHGVTTAPPSTGETPKRRKPGRPPASEKPLSQKEIDQRRGAAWQHGRHAGTALGQAIHPCRPDLCPLPAPAPAPGEEAAPNGYPCPVRDAATQQNRSLSACPVELVVNDELRAKYIAALNGDTKGLQEISATALAGMTALEHSQLAMLLKEGFTYERQLTAKDGTFLGSEQVVNPRAAPTLELAKMLGHTADQQAITPKSRGESDRDQALTKTLDLMRRRTALAAELHP